MNNWYTPLPGWWFPRHWRWDTTRWPDYTSPTYIRYLEDAPNIEDFIVFLDTGKPTKEQWGAWFGAQKEDKPITRQTEWLAVIADRTYSQARYIYLVPAWKRALTRLITEIDDLEDQVSTILWVAEIVSKRWIPIPPALMRNAQRVNTALDCAGKALGGAIPGRAAKHEYSKCLKEIKEGKRTRTQQKAGLIAWFKANWGRLLEAAQATGTWQEVGIVLGPLYAYLDEGLWGAIQRTPQIANVASEALFPGYGKVIEAAAADLMRRFEEAWDETWGSGITIEYTDEVPDWADWR